MTRPNAPARSPVIVVEHSRNDKLSAPGSLGMSTTYVTQTTCPDACPLRHNGCYAEDGLVGIHARRLNRLQRTSPKTDLELARMEARQIDELTGTRRLRAHVVGDCRTPEAAQTVGKALRRHQTKHGQRAWTYTHSWRQLRIGDWMGARVLASCETITDVREAHERRYATALLIPRVLSRKAYTIGNGFRVVPCPAQFRQPNGERQTTCDRCNICSDTRKNWTRRLVVGFQPDGRSESQVFQARLPL
jgi:hypothetical protein